MNSIVACNKFVNSDPFSTAYEESQLQTEQHSMLVNVSPQEHMFDHEHLKQDPCF